MNTKKLFALALVFVMVLGMFAGCKPNEQVTKNENKVIIGSTTDLSGDFRWPGFGGSSAGASDQDIAKMITGYSTMETNQGGAYVWNETVVKSHTEVENEDGDYVVTIEINPGLKFSDGTEVKAANYLAYILAFSSPVSKGAGHTGKSGQAFVGFGSFAKYQGADVAVEGATKEFSGVRLLGDYKFSMTISAAAGYYPYYFASTYGAVSPYPLELVLGEGVEVKDDGNGAYLTEAFYAKAAESTAEAVVYAKAAHIKAARYDVNKYPTSGPYTISSWDESTKTCTLKLNPNFAGNFEGQKPSIETIVYVKIVQETQLDQFKTGQVDILSGITGGDDTKAALAVIDGSNGKFAEVHYQRAGYGKLQFECDFGPTMFASARQAIAYVLNTSEFAEAFTGGYGTVIYGPYSPDFDMYKAVKDTMELTEYAFSVENAKKALVDGGWIYNSKGEAFVEGQTGIDSVRYKKLTAAEATEVNINFKSVANIDGVEYKTVKVGNDYYMPCVINWFGSTPNDVTDMLAARLVNNENMKAIGMVVRATTGDFDKLLGEIYREETYGYGGTPTYGMFNLATGWNSAIYDYAFNWSLDPDYFAYSANKLFDEYDKAFPYDITGEKLTYEQAVAASGDKLGMDYLSMAMVYNAKTEAEYNQWWAAYIERWNELMPDIPLYSNFYFDVYNAKIQGFKTSPFFSPIDALLYCTIANAE